MIFDTDVLIWFLRGNPKAAAALDKTDHRAVSVVSYMELLQGARDKRDSRAIRSFLTDMRFRTLPLTENTGARAAIYMEEYALAAALTMPDALIAATAAEANEELFTGNDKHFRPIKEIRVKRFRP